MSFENGDPHFSMDPDPGSSFLKGYTDHSKKQHKICYLVLFYNILKSFSSYDFSSHKVHESSNVLLIFNCIYIYQIFKFVLS